MKTMNVIKQSHNCGEPIRITKHRPRLMRNQKTISFQHFALQSAITMCRRQLILEASNSIGMVPHSHIARHHAFNGVAEHFWQEEPHKGIPPRQSNEIFALDWIRLCGAK
jgi:hypothetical protein